jgi:hypothetical protein
MSNSEQQLGKDERAAIPVQQRREFAIELGGHA